MRGAIYFLWLAISVVPYGTAILLASIFVRGHPLYWFAIGFLRQITVAARRRRCSSRARCDPRRGSGRCGDATPTASTATSSCAARGDRPGAAGADPRTSPA